MHRALSILFLVALCGFACGRPRKPSLSELKPTAEKFYTSIRWKDFRGAAEYVVPQKQSAFIRARIAKNDDRDLYITEANLEDARIVNSIATVIARLSWYRLPSTTVTQDVQEVRFVWEKNRWWVESIDTGPFDELRPTAAGTE